jgi:hypothetical protein
MGKFTLLDSSMLYYQQLINQIWLGGDMAKLFQLNKNSEKTDTNLWYKQLLKNWQRGFDVAKYPKFVLVFMQVLTCY